MKEGGGGGVGRCAAAIVREEEDVEVKVLTPGSEFFSESPRDPLSHGPVLGGLQGGRRRRRVAQGTKRSPPPPTSPLLHDTPKAGTWRSGSRSPGRGRGGGRGLGWVLGEGGVAVL